MKLSDIKIIHIPTTDILIGIIPVEGKEQKSERLAVRALLHFLLQKEVEIIHNEDGKPFIEGFHISISHTQGWATVMLSKKYNVGIDIEYQSDRVLRIAKRFLREDEAYTQISDILYAWCAKESLYKLRSTLHLGFQEMRVDVLSGVIYDSRSENSLPVLHRSTTEYLLTYVWE